MCRSILACVSDIEYCRPCAKPDPESESESDDDGDDDGHNNDGHWDYNDFEAWNHLPGSVCGTGTQQSPVDLQTAAVETDATIEPLDAVYPPLAGTLQNNGHSLVFSLDVPEMTSLTKVPTFEWSDEYVLAQMHFHWGRDHTTGSEHQIDGRPTCLELHCVHYRREYGDVATAMTQPDGLAVIGALYDIGNQHDELKKITDDVSNLTNKGASLQASYDIMLRNLLPSDFESNFWTYQGSLTTPMCYESVRWLVARTVQTVSPEQVEALRTLYADDNHEHQLTHNYRPVQPIHDRVVYTRAA